MSASPLGSSAPDEVLVIEADRSEHHYWRDVWRFRELLGYLAWRDVKVRYKQASLGVAWALIQPTVQVGLLTFVFGQLAGMPSGGLPYPLLVLTGLLPWQLFSAAFSGVGQSLVGNSHLISKIYFPRLLVPLGSLAVALLDFLIVLILTFVALLVFDISLSWRMLALPVFVGAALLAAFGAGLWVAALTVKYRDFRFVTPLLLQVGLFVTPIGYRTDLLPNWQHLLALNPLTAIVEGFRWSLLDVDPPGGTWSVMSATAFITVLLGTGLWYFRRTERQFADVI